MEIYAIYYVFDNGEEYELACTGEDYLDYYASKELAIGVLNAMDPQQILDEYTRWMPCDEIEDYEMKEVMNNNDLPSKEYERFGAYLRYGIQEIEVKES